MHTGESALRLWLLTGGASVLPIFSRSESGALPTNHVPAPWTRKLAITSGAAPLPPIVSRFHALRPDDRTRTLALPSGSVHPLPMVRGRVVSIWPVPLGRGLSLGMPAPRDGTTPATLFMLVCARVACYLGTSSVKMDPARGAVPEPGKILPLESPGGKSLALTTMGRDAPAAFHTHADRPVAATLSTTEPASSRTVTLSTADGPGAGRRDALHSRRVSPGRKGGLPIK